MGAKRDNDPVKCEYFPIVRPTGVAPAALQSSGNNCL